MAKTSSKKPGKKGAAKKIAKTVSKKTPAKKVVAKKLTPKKKIAAKKPVPKKQVVKKSATKKLSAAPGKKKKGGEELMCFLTTACVNHYGLADDCIQLSTLRWYRDSFLRNSKDGAALVDEYYKVAPQIVKAIEVQEKQGVFYPYIFSEVEASCTAIAKQEFDLARQIYQRMVLKLKAEVL